jgi:hypothetical protein
MTIRLPAMQDFGPNLLNISPRPMRASTAVITGKSVSFSIYEARREKFQDGRLHEFR